MFRRLDSGLPQDPVFPTTLEGLGYFINDKDEIRNIKNPKAYFKFFLTKNERYNVLQREAMNDAIRAIISGRLTHLGLSRICLPLDATDASPHVPIFVSSDLKTKKRVIVLFNEHNQDLGVLAHRIIGGKGGINAGSVIDMVKYVQSLPDSPGIILANMGQMLWWRQGRKAVTQASWFALPQKSAVEFPYRVDPDRNTVPGNRDTAEHVNYIFNHVVEELCRPDSTIDLVGVGQGAVKVAKFLDTEENFNKWGRRIEAFAALATYHHASDFQTPEFRLWLKKRGRAFLISDKPCGQLIAGPDGNKSIPAHGCPVFSLGEPYYTETMLAKGYKTVVGWFQEVAGDPTYVNPVFEEFGQDESEHEEEFDAPGIELNPVDEVE